MNSITQDWYFIHKYQSCFFILGIVLSCNMLRNQISLKLRPGEAEIRILIRIKIRTKSSLVSMSGYMDMPL